MKTYIFLLPTYLVYQNLFCGTLICPLSIWQFGFKLECICWTGKSVTCTVLRSTDKIQVLNELPTDKNHIKVQQNRLLCPAHVHNKKKQVFEKIYDFLNFCLCYLTRLQWGPLTTEWLLADKTYLITVKTINDLHGNHGRIHLEVGIIFLKYKHKFFRYHVTLLRQKKCK